MNGLIIGGILGLAAISAEAYSPDTSNETITSDEMNNLSAFKAMIREYESSNNYTALVGGGNFTSYLDHPYNTGEFKGIKRADGRLTTAAGAYQFTVSTWNDLGGIQKYGSFNPDAQDRAFDDRVNWVAGAMAAIKSGDITTAKQLLSGVWESLSIRDVTTVSNSFVSYGGALS